ncbi:MAG TPA: FmdB family zinc ribbon protein [Caldimonas sp.]|jgi:putative FmdB family regulatory protein|nr:FmdB family zinc ribbon protein [Caldimonas sp.]
MPIYAYRCTTCGHAQDVLRKISDPPLSVCPTCGAATFVKQVTAAGFQLKGSGWYVTDFRGDNKKSGKPAEGDAAPAAEGKAGEGGGAGDAKDASTSEAKKADGNKADAKKGETAAPAAAAAAAAAAPAAAPAPPPTPGKGGT